MVRPSAHLLQLLAEKLDGLGVYILCNQVAKLGLREPSVQQYLRHDPILRQSPYPYLLPGCVEYGIMIYLSHPG